MNRVRRDVSLARALSKLGYCSRSQAVDLITGERVTVNGRIIRNAAFRCNPTGDRIVVDGSPLDEKELIYIILNKPAGVVTTRSDELGRRTIYDLLRDNIKHMKWVFPVGRLDKDTSGLLLLTNDNRFGDLLTNPGSKIPKTYEVQLNKPL